jgi:beta-lactamase class A
MKKASVIIFILIFFSGIFLCPCYCSATFQESKNYSVSSDKRKSSWLALKRYIKQQSLAFNGKIGLVVKDLQTGLTIEMNSDDTFPSASLVKIPIMAACFKAVQEGKIFLKDKLVLRQVDIVSGSGVLKGVPAGRVITVENLIRLMVTRSDNIAANMLIDKLGRNYLNAFFKQEGLKNTNLSRKMMDFSHRKKGIENYTTPEDISFILEKMYNKQCINAEVSNQCLSLLKLQKVNDRIPKRLPEGVVVAHKTGLERQVCHDAGIVFTGQGDFLICVLTKTKAGFKPAKRFISKVAAYAYNTYQ